MIDMEKVIKGLECCKNRYPYKIDCSSCPYEKICYRDGRSTDLLSDAFALLNEQEAVRAIYDARTNWYRCGACKRMITSAMRSNDKLFPTYKFKFCSWCGKPVKWE